MNDFQLLANELSSLRNEEEGRRFIQENHKEEQFQYFFQFLKYKSEEKGVSLAKIVANSRINRNYVYNITSGIKKMPGRDKIIALCIAAEMDFAELNEALMLGGKQTINPHDPRDVWIVICINNKISDVLKVNLFLEEKGCAPINI